MAYGKVYEKIGFANGAPPSLGATNLTKIDSAINTIDDRVVELSKQSDEYAKKEEVAETYATKAEVEEISGTVTEIATEVSKGKADVILANASGESIHLTDSAESNSVEFKLIGANGSVEVISFGNNFFENKAISQNINGIEFVVNNGVFSANGRTTKETTFVFNDGNSSLKDVIGQGGTFIMSLTNAKYDQVSCNISLAYKESENGSTKFITPNENAVTIPKGSVFVRASLWIPSGTDVSINNASIQLEKGTVATPYEPYKESTTTINADESTEAEIKLFYPTTNILNDANCGMEVTYKADTKNYIDKIIGDRLSALESALINNI